MAEKLSVVITAGARPLPDASVPGRAYEYVAGKPLFQHVIDAVRSLNPEDIALVIPLYLEKDRTRLPDDVIPIHKGEGISESLRLGIKAVKNPQRVLIVDACSPALTPKALQYFRGVSLAEVDAHIRTDTRSLACLSIVPIACVHKEFPGMKKTAVNTADGAYTLGCLQYVHGDIPQETYTWIESLYRARKNPFKLAHLISPKLFGRFIASYIPGSGAQFLHLHHAEEELSQRTGMRVVSVGVPHGSVGADVDTYADLECMRKHFTVSPDPG